MKISVLHPSRSRIKKSIETTTKWATRADSPFELIVSVDDNDPELSAYQDYYGEKLLVNVNRSAIDAINNAALVATGDIFIVVSDDTDCPQGWDSIILKAIGSKSDFLLRVADGIQKRTCTMPIMDRVYYNRFGYIYNPIYLHSWCDTELTEVAYILGKIIVRNDILFTHEHPEVTKLPKDDLYLRNDQTHESGKAIFQQRQRINFGL